MENIAGIIERFFFKRIYTVVPIVRIVVKTGMFCFS